jgi:hypothetical protein
MTKRTGTAHWNWVGDAAGYQAQHQRLWKARGRADHCAWGCESSLYDWANLTGDYGDPWDYASMCRSCHVRYDDARRSMEPGFTRRPQGKQPHLTADQVRDLRTRRQAGETYAVLTARFGIAPSCICDIVHGRTYRWVR